MGRNAIETVMGALVLLVAGFFLAFAYSSSDLQKVKGYKVSAYFPMVDGLKVGTDIKMNGVKVGSVDGLNLVTQPGPDQFRVEVVLSLMPEIQLPIDTIAMVASESLLGGKYLALIVGVDEENIRTDGTGRITHTQSPMRLDDLIGQLIYGSKNSDGKSGGSSAKTDTLSETPQPPAVVDAPPQAPKPEAPARASEKPKAVGSPKAETPRSVFPDSIPDSAPQTKNSSKILPEPIPLMPEPVMPESGGHIRPDSSVEPMNHGLPTGSEPAPMPPPADR